MVGSTMPPGPSTIQDHCDLGTCQSNYSLWASEAQGPRLGDGDWAPGGGLV